MQTRLVWLLAVSLLAACSDPAKFETSELGQGRVFGHKNWVTGLAARKRTCRFSISVSGKTLSYEGTEGTAGKEAFERCLSVKNGNHFAVEKVTHVSGHHEGHKERFFARTDGGVKIQLH